MRKTRMRDILAPAAVVLLLAIPCAGAHGQSDGFFSDGGGYRAGGGQPSVGNSGSWTGFHDASEASDLNTGSWDGFQNSENPSPVGSGLLVLAASGACYAALRRRGRRE